MNIVLLSGVRQMLPAPAISLVLLTLLALGTFLAGVNFLSLRISFLGLALALLQDIQSTDTSMIDFPDSACHFA